MIQNAKQKQIQKANAQAALQACTRVGKASEPNQDIRMTNDATESEDNTDEIDLFTSPFSKCKHVVLPKTSSRCETMHRTFIR